MLKENFKRSFFSYFILLGVLLSMAGALISYQIDTASAENDLRRKADEIAQSRKSDILKLSLEHMDSIVNALATTMNTYGVDAEKERGRLISIFYAVTMSDPGVMQARFIDRRGMERIRVDRHAEGEMPFVVPPDKLQNKSHRDYFIAVSQLKEDQLWHSRLDLNIEHKKVEIPYRPTIRIARPLFLNKKFAGMVIINMLTGELINHLRRSTVFDHYIIDKDGYFILHPEKQFSWSRYTPEKKKLQDLFPKEASEIRAGGKRPGDFFAFPLTDVLRNDDGAILLLKPKVEYKKTLIYDHIKSALIISMISILISLPLSLFVSIGPSRLQKALLTSNEELERFAGIIDRYVISVTTDLAGVIQSVSSAFVKISGYTREELVGQKVRIVRHKDMASDLFRNLWKTVSGGKEWRGEIKNQTKDGNEYWLDQTVIPLKDFSGKNKAYMAVGVDISARKRLEVLSETDQLTGLCNRHKLDRSLKQEMEKARRYKRELSYILIDIDYFKRINDTYGHASGDEVLVKVAEILRSHVRSSDIVGRMGGEEFLIISPETDGKSAFLLAEKLRRITEEYPFSQIGQLTISIGVAQLRDGVDATELLSLADQALYQAKREGRNRSVLFQEAS